MIEYNDSECIERIRAAMEADPKLSRRAAIILIAGKSNLRRIEMKMRDDVDAQVIDPPVRIGGVRHLIGHLELVEGKVISTSNRGFVVKQTDGDEREFDFAKAFSFVQAGDRVRFLVNIPPAKLDLRRDEVVLFRTPSGDIIEGQDVTAPAVVPMAVGLFSFVMAMCCVAMLFVQTSMVEIILGAGFLLLSALLLSLFVFFDVRRKGRLRNGLKTAYGHLLDVDEQQEKAFSGYDDSPIIEQVRSLMEKDATLSRRAAIITVAGEESLRRIEMKMSEQDKDDGILAPRRLAWLVPFKVGERNLLCEEGRILKVGEEGFWFEFKKNRAFLRFSEASRYFAESRRAKIVRAGDLVVAVECGGQVYHNGEVVEWSVSHVAWWTAFLVSTAILLRVSWYGSALPDIVEIGLVPLLLGISMLSGMKIVGLLSGMQVRSRGTPFQVIRGLVGAG